MGRGVGEAEAEADNGYTDKENHYARARYSVQSRSTNEGSVYPKDKSERNQKKEAGVTTKKKKKTRT